MYSPARRGQPWSPRLEATNCFAITERGARLGGYGASGWEAGGAGAGAAGGRYLGADVANLNRVRNTLQHESQLLPGY